MVMIYDARYEVIKLQMTTPDKRKSTMSLGLMRSWVSLH